MYGMIYMKPNKYIGVHRGVYYSFFETNETSSRLSVASDSNVVKVCYRTWEASNNRNGNNKRGTRPGIEE